MDKKLVLWIYQCLTLLLWITPSGDARNNGLCKLCNEIKDDLVWPTGNGKNLSILP